MNCTYCGNKVTPRTSYVEKVGWAKPRLAGGTNALIGAKETGRLACLACITKIKDGVGIRQGTL